MDSTGDRTRDLVEHKVRRTVGFAALRRIDALVSGWEQEHQRSRRIAVLAGIVLGLLLAGVVSWFYLSGSYTSVPLR